MTCATIRPPSRPMLLNLTRPPGGMLLVTRQDENEFAARFIGRVRFIDFKGARNRDTSRRLAAALNRDRGTAVRSLRRDSHTKDKTCWLHGRGWCLSRLTPVEVKLTACRRQRCVLETGPFGEIGPETRGDESRDCLPGAVRRQPCSLLARKDGAHGQHARCRHGARQRAGGVLSETNSPSTSYKPLRRAI